MGNLVKITPRPGMFVDGTRYSNGLTWVDGNLVRFRGGRPESMGGWQKVNSTAFKGTCRCLFQWSGLDAGVLLFIGTHWKTYVEEGGSLTDITPLRLDDAAVGTDPFTTVNGSTTVTVAHASHGAVHNDFVTLSGSGDLNGIPAAELFAEHQITYVDANSYTISVTTAATGSGSGGGVVTGDYEINVGNDTFFYGAGYGAGTYSRGGWGSAADVTVAGEGARIWSADSFGEDLIFTARNGATYYWDYSAGGRAVEIGTLGGASNTPTKTLQTMVSDVDRHVIAFGVNALGSGTADPMNIRWSDAEDATDWTPAISNSAGDMRLSYGSEIVTAYQSRQEILIWTDVSLHSMAFIGAPYYFSLQTLATNVSIVGPKAKVAFGDTVYWMGGKNFFAYDGRVHNLHCPLEDKIYGEIDAEQIGLVYAGANQRDGEVWWFYKSTSGSNNDKYVIYHVEEKIWYFGALGRTAWIDRGLVRLPRATDASGFLYYQESGLDDGSTSPESAVASYIESGPIEMGEGDRLMFCNRIIPDISFNRSTNNTPKVDFTSKTQDYPGANLVTDATGADTVSRTSTTPVEQYTENIYVRLRGRTMTMRVSNSTTGVAWQMGTPRIEVRSDGRR